MERHEQPLLVGDELQARLKELAWPISPQDEAEIFHRVCDYADGLKALGLPPERVIVAVKRAANDAGLHSNSRALASTARLDGVDKLLVDMVRWCIERYYGAPLTKSIRSEHRGDARA